MKVSIDYIRQQFHVYNKMCFGATLPEPQFRLSRATRSVGRLTVVRRRNMLGHAAATAYTLFIHQRFDIGDPELDDTIIHEMIHFYIAFHGVRDTSAHGREFRRMMDDINHRFGRHVTISRRATEEDRRDAPLRQHIVCVATFADGKVGVVSCARTRVFDIYRLLPRAYSLQSMDWYFTTDRFFDRLPRSTRPVLYKVSADELAAHLATALPLVCDGRSLRRKTV